MGRKISVWKSALAYTMLALLFNICISNAAEYETIKMELTFISDVGAVDLGIGHNQNLERPRGFRKDGMKIEYNGSLGQFNISRTSIRVIKYEQ